VKVVYVVPRYGTEVIGGAEFGARMLAEHLVQAGSSVEVCTTCAVDLVTWGDHYSPGTVDVNGVSVHRFRSDSGRHPSFDRLTAEVLADPAAASPEAEARWLSWQGPVCPEALDAAEGIDADVVVLYPYLYWPTVHGVERFGPKAVLHPATHDEAPVRLPVFRRVFTSPGGLVFHTVEERRLTERLFPPVAALPQAIVGLGVTPTAGDPGEARAVLGLGERPFLLCVGRVDDGKGSRLLHDLFVAYKRRHPGSLALVFAGPVANPLPPHPDVVVAGAVGEAVKWGVLRAAELLVSPSAHESFSLVLLESWLAGRAVLVNAACPVTRRQAQLAGGGVWFDSYRSFEVAVERLLGDDALREALARAGERYVRLHYPWPRLINRYQRFLEGVAERAVRRPPGKRPARRGPTLTAW
jgi:glycosyltransferase involved in cell wall biosynthesis